MRSTLLCILLCIGQVTVYSQRLIFFKPENLRQLPSSETYNVMQDSKGYIWFSTEAGLCRYNGDNIKVFDENSGLPEGATYFVTEDKKGNIWAGTSKNRILKYNSGKFVEAPFTKKVTDYLTGLHQLENFGWINDSVMQIETQFDLTLRININNNEVTAVPKVKENFTFYIHIYENGSLFKTGPIDNRGAYEMIINRRIRACISKGGRKTTVTIPYTRSAAPNWRYTSAINQKGEAWIGVDCYLLKLNTDGTINYYIMPATILALKCDADNGLWLGLLNNGLHYFPDCDIKKRVVNFSELSVSGIAFDKEGGVWCTTLKKGVFYCRNKSIIDYSNREDMAGNIDLMKYLNGHLYLSAHQGYLSEITEDTIIRHQLPQQWRGAITDIVQSDKGWALCSNHFLLSADPFLSKFSKVKTKRGKIWVDAGGKFLIKKTDGKIYGASYSIFFSFSGQEASVKTVISLSGMRCLAVYKDEVLAGCKNGLYRIRDSAMQKIEGLDAEIRRILVSKDGTVWILAHNDGIYQMRDGRITSLKEKISLKTKRFLDITEDESGNIWLASNGGIVKLTPAQDGYREAYYNTLSGIPSDDIVHIAATRSAIYFSTPEGLCSFEIPEKLRNETAPALSIASLRVNNKKVPFDSGTLQFPYYENTIRLKLNVFTYRRAGAPPVIWYNLDGSDKDFQVLRADELNLVNLSPGKYHLKICAVNEDGLVSKNPVELHMEILPPFWKTNIFQTAILIVLLGLVYIIVRVIIKGIRKREKEKTRINTMLAEYHMSALRAQMNPHFIFNCINSIQRYILTNQAKEAYNYLTKFSRLIRLVLNYAEKNLITLQQELEIVELYLALEQLRFGDKFTYTIQLNQAVPADKLFVPVLIIQPYVENSIWHGIMNLPEEKKGHINVAVALENKILIIKIEDNGVGREVAAQFSRKDHDSKSTWINKKRAEIINMEGTDIENVTLEDIKNADGTVGGTRAIIRIKQIKPVNHE